MPFQVYCDSNSPGACPYENLSRRELQALAKQHGIRANIKSSAIVAALRDANKLGKPSPKRKRSTKSSFQDDPVDNSENVNPNQLPNKKTKLDKRSALTTKQKQPSTKDDAPAKPKKTKSDSTRKTKTTDDTSDSSKTRRRTTRRSSTRTTNENAQPQETSLTIAKKKSRDMAALKQIVNEAAQVGKVKLAESEDRHRLRIEQAQREERQHEQTRERGKAVASDAARAGLVNAKQVQLQQRAKQDMRVAAEHASRVAQDKLEEQERHRSDTAANKVVMSQAIGEAAQMARNKAEMHLRELELMRAEDEHARALRQKSAMHTVIQAAAKTAQDKIRVAEEARRQVNDSVNEAMCVAMRDAAATAQTRNELRARFAQVARDAANKAIERKCPIVKFLRPFVCHEAAEHCMARNIDRETHRAAFTETAIVAHVKAAKKVHAKVFAEAASAGLARNDARSTLRMCADLAAAEGRTRNDQKEIVSAAAKQAANAAQMRKDPAIKALKAMVSRDAAQLSRDKTHQRDAVRRVAREAAAHASLKDKREAAKTVFAQAAAAATTKIAHREVVKQAAEQGKVRTFKCLRDAVAQQAAKAGSEHSGAMVTKGKVKALASAAAKAAKERVIRIVKKTRAANLKRKMTGLQAALAKQAEMKAKLAEARKKRKRMEEEADTSDSPMKRLKAMMEGEFTNAKGEGEGFASPRKVESDKEFAARVLAMDLNFGKENAPSTKDDTTGPLPSSTADEEASKAKRKRVSADDDKEEGGKTKKQRALKTLAGPNGSSGPSTKGGVPTRPMSRKQQRKLNKAQSRRQRRNAKANSSFRLQNQRHHNKGMGKMRKR